MPATSDSECFQFCCTPRPAFGIADPCAAGGRCRELQRGPWTTWSSRSRSIVVACLSSSMADPICEVVKGHGLSANTDDKPIPAHVARSRCCVPLDLERVSG